MIYRVVIEMRDGTFREWKVSERTAESISVRFPTEKEPWFFSVFQGDNSYAIGVDCINSIEIAN